jgi:hypothetical protein
MSPVQTPFAWMHQTCCSVGGALDFSSVGPRLDSQPGRDIVTEDFYGFPWAVQVNSGTVPQATTASFPIFSSPYIISPFNVICSVIVKLTTKQYHTHLLWAGRELCCRLVVENNEFWEEQITYCPWYDSDRIENDTSDSYSIVASVFVDAILFLLSRCLVTTAGYTFRGIDWWEIFMKWAVEIGSGAMIYVPSFIKIRSGINFVIRGLHRHRLRGDHISLLYFFGNKVGKKFGPIGCLYCITVKLILSRVWVWL